MRACGFSIPDEKLMFAHMRAAHVSVVDVCKLTKMDLAVMLGSGSRILKPTGVQGPESKGGVNCDLVDARAELGIAHVWAFGWLESDDEE